MVNSTQLLDMNAKTQTTRSQKKQSAVDAAEFANLLSAQTFQASTSKSFTDIGIGRSNDSTQTETELKSKTADKTDNPSIDNSENRSQSNAENTNETKTHSRKDGSTEASQHPNQSSDSGQKQSGDSATGVDGRENGIQPGASTEAAVNAQSFFESSEAENAIELNIETTDVSPNEAFQDLIQQIIAETSPQSTDSESIDAIKISAKAIDPKPTAIQTNLNLTDQKIMFETGLAEHFVRLLTDQFEAMQNSTAQSTETPDAAQTIETASTAINGSSQQSSQSSMDLLFQTAADTQTPDTKAADNINKIVNVVRSNIGHRQSQITVRLDPPELGQMRVDIKLVDNNLQLAITTETNEARQMLTSRMETLRQTLEQNGIHMAKFEVVTQTNDSQANQNQNWQQQNGQQSNSNGFQSNQQQQEQSENQGNTSANADETESKQLFTETTGSTKTVNLVA